MVYRSIYSNTVMIRYIENIGLVNEFKFLNNYLITLTQNEIRNAETNLSRNGDFYCIRPWKTFLLTQNKQENNILILDRNLDIVKEISGESNYALWLLNACSLIPVGDKVFKLLESLELQETKISIFPKDCISKFGIRRAKNSVLCDNLNTNQLKWQFELGEEIKVAGDFILINGIVIVPTTNQDLIGIGIETGKELWRLKNINTSHFQIQFKTNYLISLVSNSVGDNWYYVIDPKTGQKIIDKKFNNFFFGAGGSKACITETHYYFISNEYGYPSEHRTERITHLGCINLQTHELEWVEKIGTTSDRRSEYQKPEIHNGKFYLLDGEQTLHIYETSSSS